MKQAGDLRRLGQLRADIATSLLSGRTHIHNPDPHDTGNPRNGDADGRDDGDGGRAAGESSDQARRGVVKVPAPRAPQPATPTIAAATASAAEPADDPTTADAAASAGRGSGAPRVGVRARIQLNVPLTTLMGLSQRPGELGGFGPIVTEVARRLTLNQLTNPDARYTVGVTHPITGQLLHLHPLPQRFLRGLQAELVHALNQRCIWPTCRRPAPTCDLDHNTPHADGGPTTPTNTAPLCPHHHTAKTESAWTLHQTTPGHYRLTNPHGRHHHTHPPTHPPNLTDPAPPPQLPTPTYTAANNDDTDAPPF
nr:HNH endonuclease signature motif containing protein [Actinopolymorpha pittospori]